MIATTKSKKTREKDPALESLCACRGGVAKAARPKTKSGRGVSGGDAELNAAAPAETNGQAAAYVTPMGVLPGPAGGGEEYSDAERSAAATCLKLQELQRQKVVALKSRIMLENRLIANVKVAWGYSASLQEPDRDAMHKKAVAFIESINPKDYLPGGSRDGEQSLGSFVANSKVCVKGFDKHLGLIEKDMLRLVRQLPIAAWVKPGSGFALPSLATVIGETGDLSNYSNPAKVWKRLGCAPFNGKMPSTWRSKGGLSAEEWSTLGYSPRRRSIAYVIGECIVRCGKGVYRRRYDEAKAAAKVNHPDWTDGHAHNHAMLLATKRLLRDLWCQWNKVAVTSPA
jgi:hypothetical protein